MKEVHPMCPICRNWNRSIKAGTPRGKQRYKCKDCGLHYTATDEYTSSGKGKHKYEFLFKRFVCREYTSIKKEGGSLRQLVKDINNSDNPLMRNHKKLTHTTILDWMKKYEVYKQTGEKF